MPRKVKLKIAQVLYVSKSTEEEIIFLPARECFTFVARSNPHLNFAWISSMVFPFVSGRNVTWKTSIIIPQPNQIVREYGPRPSCKYIFI